MQDTASYPGVYVQEIPSGAHTILAVSTSVTAFVGRAWRGPVNTPTGIGSFADFERSFGGLQADFPLSYAVRDFFQNGGGQGVVVRLYAQPADPSTQTTATITLAPAAGPALVLQAADPGDWANGALTVTVDDDGITAATVQRLGLAPSFAPGDLFNLTVTAAVPGEAGTSERFINVSLRQDAGVQRLDRVLEQQSRLIRYPMPEGTAPATPAAGAAGTAAGGTASAYLQDTDYLGHAAAKTGMYALESQDLFNLLVMPMDRRLEQSPTVPGSDVFEQAAAYCAARRAFLLVEPPASWSASAAAGRFADIQITDLGSYGPEGRNAAVYFPRLVEQDPLAASEPRLFSASGAVAGIMARTDAARGVWKAPAGIADGAISGIQGLEITLTDAENGDLNPQGINCLRTFPVYGSVVWGARTLKGADVLMDDYRYVPTRRLTLYIEESLYRGTQWAAFEPNAEPLWTSLRLAVDTFMGGLFQQGAFAGSTASDAYFVACDATTTTPADVEAGFVNVTVGFAALVPAEFLVLQIRQVAGQVSA